jgi:hypothetical protein
VKLNKHIIFNELCGLAPELISGRETGLNLEQVKYPRKGVETGNNENPGTSSGGLFQSGGIALPGSGALRGRKASGRLPPQRG